MNYKRKNKELDEVQPETLEIFEEVAIVEPEEDADEMQVLCGVVLKRYPVVSYNKYSGVLVYDRGDVLVQTYCRDYDGCGWYEAE